VPERLVTVLSRHYVTWLLVPLWVTAWALLPVPIRWLVPWSELATTLDRTPLLWAWGLAISAFGVPLIISAVARGKARKARAFFDAYTRPAGLDHEGDLYDATLRGTWSGRWVHMTLKRGEVAVADRWTIEIPVDVRTRWSLYPTRTLPRLIPAAWKLPPLDYYAQLPGWDVRAEDPAHLDGIIQNPFGTQALMALEEVVPQARIGVDLYPGHLVLTLFDAHLSVLRSEHLERWRDALLDLASVAERTPVSSSREASRQEIVLFASLEGNDSSTGARRRGAASSLTRSAVLGCCGLALALALTVVASLSGARAGTDVRGVVATADGGCAIVGVWAKDRSHRSDALLMALDHDGTPRWTRTYGGDGEDVGYGVVRTDDGFAIAGVDGTSPLRRSWGWLIETDQEGLERRVHRFGVRGAARNLALATDARGFVLVGDDDDAPFTAHLDDDGHVDWRHTCFGTRLTLAPTRDDQNGGEQRSIQPYKGGTISGGTFDAHARSPRNRQDHAALEALDERGRRRWHYHAWGVESSAIHQLAVRGAEVWAVGHVGSRTRSPTIWRLDADSGQLLWHDDAVERRLRELGEFTAINATEDGWVIAGNLDEVGWIGQLDSAGRPIWERTIASNDLHVRDVAVMEGGDLMVVGTVTARDGLSHGWAMRLSPNGSLRWFRPLDGPANSG